MKGTKRAKKPALDFAECGLCGERMAPDETIMMVHVATAHPLQLFQHRSVAPAIGRAAFELGAKLAEALKR